MLFSIIEIFCVPSCYQISSILLLFSNRRESNRMEILSNLFSENNDWPIKVLFRRNFENRSQYFILQIESFFKKLHNYHWIIGNRMDSRNGTLLPVSAYLRLFLVKISSNMSTLGVMLSQKIELHYGHQKLYMQGGLINLFNHWNILLSILLPNIIHPVTF